MYTRARAPNRKDDDKREEKKAKNNNRRERVAGGSGRGILFSIFSFFRTATAIVARYRRERVSEAKVNSGNFAVELFAECPCRFGAELFSKYVIFYNIHERVSYLVQMPEYYATGITIKLETNRTSLDASEIEIG